MAVGKDVVFLEQLVLQGIAMQVGGDPAFGNGPRQGVFAIVAQAVDGDPLQRGPAVGRIPLLAGMSVCRCQAPGLEQFALE